MAATRHIFYGDCVERWMPDGKASILIVGGGLLARAADGMTHLAFAPFSGRRDLFAMFAAEPARGEGSQP